MGGPFSHDPSMPTNSAFVFIKPHAVTDKVKELTGNVLTKNNIKILEQGEIKSEEIDSKKLIDQHYYAIASKATILKPNQLNVPADKFKEQFGLEWEEALKNGNVYNAMDGCAKLDITPDELDTQWGICKKAKKLVKFGGGFYCGLIEIEGKDPVYIFNGFFMSMRNKFTAPGLSIYYYVVEWEAASLAWEYFRDKVLGPTDPAEAPADSLRGMVLSDWEKLGLKEVPNTGDNAVHASASPFEAMAERCNWLKVPVTEDPFAQALLASGVEEQWIVDGMVDPQVPLGDGKKGSLFDAVEALDTDACITKLCQLGLNLKNTAFVFVKPHAVTEDVKSLVKTTLEGKGLKVLTEGEIASEVIDEKKLIDQHYYAIASKATILKPEQLNVPADKFKAQFNIGWDEALKAGKVYNAMDACDKLGVTSDELDKLWGSSKKAGTMVKFGGGFYCGLIKDLYVFNGFFMSMRNKFCAPGLS